MTSTVQTGVAVWCLVCSLSNHATADGKSPFDKNEALAALKSSKDALYLQRMAIKLIETNDSAVLKRIAELLGDAGFLERLESRADLESQDRQRIQFVLNALGKLGTSEAEQLLLGLAENKIYADDPTAIHRLVHVMSFIKKPSKKLIAFLNAQADDPNTKLLSTVVRIFLYMAQPETLAEAEQRYYSPQVRGEMKESWAIGFMLFHRHNPELLQLYKRLLQSDQLDRRLKNWLVLSLFDFQPSWYGFQLTAPLPPAPEHNDAPSDVLRELHQLADLSLKLDVPAETKTVVQKARQEIDDILAKRGKK